MDFNPTGQLRQHLIIAGAAIVGIVYMTLVRLKLETLPTECMAGLLIGLIILATLIYST